MPLPQILAKVRKCPGMFLPAVTYDAAASFVMGYDIAVHGGLLWAFREWLIPQLNGGSNMAWPGLVQMLMERRTPTSEAAKKEPPVKHQAAAVEFLLATIETFLHERDHMDGAHRIFASYERWLKEQDWYGPSSPHWIPSGQ